MSEVNPTYYTTPPPLPEWYTQQYFAARPTADVQEPDEPEPITPWLWPPPEHVIKACRKLTELSKTLKYFRYDN